jgi:arylsulfatase A-like enzyme
MSRNILKTWLAGSPRRSAGDASVLPPPVATAAEVLVFAVWFGSLSGLAEAALAVWRQRIRYFPTGEFVAPEVFWMAPLAAIVTMLLAAVVLIGAALILRRPGLLRAAPPAFAAMAVLSMLRAMRFGLSTAGAAVLALGVGAVVHRTLAARPAPARRIVRSTAPPLVVGILVWAMAVPAWRIAAEASAVAALPEPPAAAPNVLIVIWDAARAQSLSLYGYTRETTPELDRLARRGVVFDRAFATAPWSLPSHASMFTGRYPTEMTAARQVPLDDSDPTLAEVLSARGYATAGFTANIYYGSSAFGISRGFIRYEDGPPTGPRLILGTWRLSRYLLWQVRDRATENAPGPMRPSASNISDALLDWMDDRGDRPFFAVINQFDAHDPYFPPEPFNVAFADSQPRFWLEEEHVAYSADELSELRDAYDGALRYLDHELGRLLGALEERGVLDNTLVIVTSDHGEEFGEHGADLVKHARSLYTPVLLVPLVVVYPPRVPGGVRRGEPVSIRDIPATVMDVLGFADHPFPGLSLLGYAEGSVTAEQAAEPRLAVAESSPMGGVLPTWPIAAGDMYSLVSGDLHYIVDGAGREQLFDLSTDVWERNDLAGRAEAEPHLRRFRAVLDSMAGPAASRRAYRVLGMERRPSGR